MSFVVLLLLLVLLLYTFGIFGFRQQFRKIYLLAIIFGVLLDWVTVRLMSAQAIEAGNAYQPHVIVGYLALLGMTVIGGIALYILAHADKIGDLRVIRSLIVIKKYGNIAYYFWVISLLLGAYVMIIAGP